MEKRRFCRSLFEGSYFYLLELGKSVNGDCGYRVVGYREVVILEDFGLFVFCLCFVCEEKLALFTVVLYGLRLEREVGEGWVSEVSKFFLYSMRFGYFLFLLVLVCGYYYVFVFDYSCLKLFKAGEERYEGCFCVGCFEGRYGYSGYFVLVTYSYGGVVFSYCLVYGRVFYSCGVLGEGRGYFSFGVYFLRVGFIFSGGLFFL